MLWRNLTVLWRDSDRRGRRWAMLHLTFFVFNVVAAFTFGSWVNAAVAPLVLMWAGSTLVEGILREETRKMRVLTEALQQALNRVNGPWN